MLQAVFSPTSKCIYSFAQAGLSCVQKYNPAHQHLILRVQRVAMVLDALLLMSDYKVTMVEQ